MTPNTKARGKIRLGLRTSPAILLTSHQPPKEKNAPTMAAPSAGIRGKEPGRCATKGMKLDQDPSRNAVAHTVSRPSTANLSHVIQRRKPALTRMLTMFKKHRAQTAANAVPLLTGGEE